MNRIAAARARIDQAADLPGVLDAAYDAFEDILAVLRHHQERAGGAFPAFVLAAGAAANGRDWIFDAPSLPPGPSPARPPATAGELLTRHGWVHVALEVAAISHALAAALTGSAAQAADPGDRTACEHAAGHATRIRELLAGAREP